MAFEVHREPLYRRYYASYASGAFCYAVCFGFLLIFLPLIIAYNSSSFWIKEAVLYEQPSVSYRYQAIIEVFGQSVTQTYPYRTPFTLYYSSSSVLNQLHGRFLRVPILQTAELDDNNDGIVDRLVVFLNMPLAPEEDVTGISAVFLHDVKLKNRARYIFDAASLITYESSTPISTLRIDGDIKLRQTWPLSVKGGFKVPYSGNPLLSTALSIDVPETETSLSAIMMATAARNLSTTFVPTYQLADRSTLRPSLDPSVKQFNMTLTMRIPEQAVKYTPSVSEVLKYSWIQYISFFAVVSFVLFRLSSFVFRHQLLYTYSTADIVTEKMD